MRALRLAIAASIIAIATPVGAALPQLALACGSAPAGQDVPCTISRVAGGRGVYVLFQTSDSTAKVGTDYTAVSEQVYLSAGTPSLALAVHTLVNPNATGTLTFNAALAGGAAVVRAVGNIVEPAPLPPVPTLGTVIAVQACQSLINPANALTIGATYTEVGFAAMEPVGGDVDPANVTAKDVVILNDGVTTRGDGWFALWVPIGCVSSG